MHHISTISLPLARWRIIAYSARPLQLRAVRPMSSPRGPALEMRICGIAADGCTVVTWHPCRAGSRGQEPGACPGVQHRGGRAGSRRRSAAVYAANAGGAAGNATARCRNWSRRRPSTGGSPPVAVCHGCATHHTLLCWVRHPLQTLMALDGTGQLSARRMGRG